MKPETFQYIRIILYLMLLGALLYVAFSKFDDPCDRCRFSITQGHSTMEWTCREYVKSIYDNIVENNTKADYAARTGTNWSELMDSINLTNP